MMMFVLLVLTSTVLGDCDVVERKSCPGRRQILDRWTIEKNRLSPEQTALDHEVGTLVWKWCEKMCEYYGQDGCCGYDIRGWDDVWNSKCYFVAGGSPIVDNAEKKEVIKFGYMPEYEITPLKYGGKCTWSGKEVMIPNANKGGCDYDGRDSEGTRSLGGGGHDAEECKAFCMKLGDACVHASLSSSGYCHTFKTCNYHNIDNDYGATMFQKVHQDAPYNLKTPKVDLSCKCSGYTNSGGKGGPQCSAAGHNKPWCYVDPSASCADRKGSAVQWSEQACKNLAAEEETAIAGFGQGMFENGDGCHADRDCASGNCEMMGMGDSVCAPSSTESLAYQQKASPASGITFVHVFAAFGFAVTAYGAFRHYVK